MITNKNPSSGVRVKPYVTLSSFDFSRWRIQAELPIYLLITSKLFFQYLSMKWIQPFTVALRTIRTLSTISACNPRHKRIILKYNLRSIF